MGTTAFLTAAGVFKALTVLEQNKALDEESKAAAEQANLEIEELERQRGEVQKQARAEKSDRAREADKQFASMVASMADNGGAGTQNESRFGAEIGYYEGIDLARVESNRKNQIASLHAEQIASRQTAVNIVQRNKRQQKINFFSALTEGARMGMHAASAKSTGAGAAGKTAGTAKSGGTLAKGGMQ